MKYPYDLKRKLDHALADGTQASRIELGIARMAQREGPGKWFVARQIPGDERRFQLMGKKVARNNVSREWVESVAGAQPYPTYRDALSVCAVQGTGVPMHEREAVRVFPDAGLARAVGELSI